MDARAAKYVSCISLQKGGEDIINNLQPMVQKLIHNFAKRNAGKLPRRVVILRDGFC